MNNTNTDLSLKTLRNLQRLVKLITVTDNIPLKPLLGSEGNMKIPSSTAIFNISSATDCASKKLGLCKAASFGVKCYALKAEQFRPECLPYRRRQAKLWDKISAHEFAKQFIIINHGKRSPFTALRLNESGDFRNQADVDKAEEIARLLHLQSVRTYCYTSRNDLNFSQCKNIILSGSGFRKPGIAGEFKIIKNKKLRPRLYGMCAGNCRICNRCQIRGKLTCILPH